MIIFALFLVAVIGLSGFGVWRCYRAYCQKEEELRASMTLEQFEEYKDQDWLDRQW